MKYEKTVTLKTGVPLQMRNGCETDAQAVYENFIQTHTETDYLLSYADERSFDPDGDAACLKEKAESADEVELIALIDGKVVGTAGVQAVGKKYKVKHRAEFGISILKDYWGQGIGRVLTECCIDCARKAGYAQLELSVVANNKRAIQMYQKAGFKEYGRNPKGFNSRLTGFQELVYMRLEL